MNYKNRLAAVADTLEEVKTQADGLQALPALDSPASEADVVKGKEFIDEAGEKKTGTHEPYTLPAMTDPAGENDVREGKEYIDANGVKQYGRLKMDGVWTPDWSTYVPIEVQYDSDDRFLVMKNLDGVGGGSAAVTRTVRFSYFTVDESTPAWDISYFVGGDGLWPDWIGGPSWCNAVDGEEIQLSSGQVLFIQCDGIGGYSYYCDISGGCRGVTIGDNGYAVLVVDPDNEADITITSMYAP